MLETIKYNHRYANTQEKKSLNAILILEKLKKHLQIKTNTELARILNVKPNTISTWKRRNSVDYELIVSICQQQGIDLNTVFYRRKPTNGLDNSNRQPIPLVSREHQFQYVLQLDEDSFTENLPAYDLPFVEGENLRAFQVVGNAMHPTFEDNSIVIATKCQSTSAIEDNKNYVVISKLKGIFINSVKISESSGELILINHNKTMPHQMRIRQEEIAEIWEIVAKFSYSPVGEKQEEQATTL
ncbi:LexA family transcriptional regulator [Sinomicrobium sp.]